MDYKDFADLRDLSLVIKRCFLVELTSPPRMTDKTFFASYFEQIRVGSNSDFLHRPTGTSFECPIHAVERLLYQINGKTIQKVDGASRTLINVPTDLCCGESQFKIPEGLIRLADEHGLTLTVTREPKKCFRCEFEGVSIVLDKERSFPVFGMSCCLAGSYEDLCATIAGKTLTVVRGGKTDVIEVPSNLRCPQ